MTNHLMKLGNLVLSSPDSAMEQIALRGYSIDLYSDVSFGSGERVTTSVPWQIVDGSQVTEVGRQNRVMQATVVCESPDLAGLEVAERLLWQEVGKPSNVLSWQPPADLIGASTTVWDVQSADLVFQYDDLAEMSEGTLRRVWALTLTCLPYGHSVDEVEITAVRRPSDDDGYDPIIDVLYDGTSLDRIVNNSLPAGWGSVTAAPGGGARLGFYHGSGWMGWNPLGGDDPTRPFVRVRAVASDGSDLSSSITARQTGGTGVFPVSARVGDWYYIGLTGTTQDPSIRVTVLPGTLDWVDLKEIQRVDEAPLFGGRTLIQSFDVPGNAPTAGRLHVSSMDSFGDILMISYSDELGSFVPHMSPEPFSPPIIPDSTAVSGGYRLSNQHRDVVPVSDIPAGSYMAWMRARADTAPISQGYKVTSSIEYPDLGVAGWATYADLTTEWKWIPLLRLPFPVTPIREGVIPSVAELKIRAETAFRLDTVVLIPESASVVLIESNEPEVTVESPTPESPIFSCWEGGSMWNHVPADRYMLSPPPVWEGGKTYVLATYSPVPDADATLSVRPAWQHHALGGGL